MVPASGVPWSDPEPSVSLSGDRHTLHAAWGPTTPVSIFGDNLSSSLPRWRLQPPYTAPQSVSDRLATVAIFSQEGYGN